MTGIEISILHLLQQHGEIQGTARLAIMLGTNAKHEVFTAACLLAKNGLIKMEISHKGGRGCPTIYRCTNVLTVQR